MSRQSHCKIVEYVTIRSFLLPLLVGGVMINKILHIILIFLFSLTIISCSSTTSTEDTTTEYSTTDVFDPEGMQTHVADPELGKIFEEMGIEHTVYMLQPAPVPGL